MLERGKVESFRKQTGDKEEPLILEAGEALQYDSEQVHLAKSSGAQQASTLWKKGVLRFVDTETAKVMEEMETMYGVENLLDVPEEIESTIDISLPSLKLDTHGQVPG